MCLTKCNNGNLQALFRMRGRKAKHTHARTHSILAQCACSFRQWVLCLIKAGTQLAFFLPRCIHSMLFGQIQSSFSVLFYFAVSRNKYQAHVCRRLLVNSFVSFAFSRLPSPSLCCNMPRIARVVFNHLMSTQTDHCGHDYAACARLCAVAPSIPVLDMLALAYQFPFWRGIPTHYYDT